MARILLADTDKYSIHQIRAGAKAHGHILETAHDGITAIKMAMRNAYDVILLEAYQSDIDGYVVCRHLRKSLDIPILFVTSKAKEHDRLRSFEAGGDDHIIKPFYVSELFARINVHMSRKASGQKKEIFSFAGVTVNIPARTVYVDERRINLSPREYDLLVYLCGNADIALSRSMILDNVWGADFEGLDRTVDSHIKTLREQLKPYGASITSVWGYGYKLET